MLGIEIERKGDNMPKYLAQISYDPSNLSQRITFYVELEAKTREFAIKEMLKWEITNYSIPASTRGLFELVESIRIQAKENGKSKPERV